MLVYKCVLMRIRAFREILRGEMELTEAAQASVAAQAAAQAAAPRSSLRARVSGSSTRTTG